MDRRQFLNLTGTFTGGALVLPDFLYSFANQSNGINFNSQCLVFIQLNGGNDGLNTFIPYENPLYYELRPKIALSKDEIIRSSQGMAFHPSLKDFAAIQQSGDLTVIQNVGYPNPDRSHFRSQEIWQTASKPNEFLNNGWIGRYLDHDHNQYHITNSVNIDNIDNLALKGLNTNSITIKNPQRFTTRNQPQKEIKNTSNPQLDFVRRIANSVTEAASEIQTALDKSPANDALYSKTGLGKNLEWIAKLIKGDLNSKIYYTSLNGFDTHDNQLLTHNAVLKQLNDAVFSFYKDLKNAKVLQNVSIVIFSEFGRRVKDNGNGTDHGTAAPMFVIGGNNKGKIIGKNPDLFDLDNGDLKHEIDFRSVYATLLKNKFRFDANAIGIQNQPFSGLF